MNAPTDFAALADHAYKFAEQHYGDKDARFDVIVECMARSEIADELREQGITDYAAAENWAKERAGLQHEAELNQAWDGPESVKSSSHYDPAHDPAGPQDDPSFCPACGNRGCKGECPEMREAMSEDFTTHIDSYTGHPIYTANTERARKMMEPLGPPFQPIHDMDDHGQPVDPPDSALPSWLQERY